MKPIILRDDEHKLEYTLEFNRESVKFAESRGFDIDDVKRFPMTKIPELFFYAFRMHHRNISREKTDRILFEDLNGMTEKMVEKLGALYAAPFDSLVNTEENANPKMTVEM